MWQWAGEANSEVDITDMGATMEQVAQVNDHIPEPLPWEQRAKGANPLPGGYSGYLDALRKILSRMAQSAMSFEQLVVWMQEEFDIAETSARTRLHFMKKAGLIGSDVGFVTIEDEARCWLDGGGDSMLIAVLHSRVRFVGEMLEELRTPKSVEQLRQIAARYGFDWEKQTQINNRRGWLESAKLIAGRSQRLELTDAGLDLVSRLEIFRPSAKEGARVDEAIATELPHGSREETCRGQPSTHDAETLSSEILVASTDSADPARFERAVREGFRFMGFVAEHLGGSGKTDVLLTAPLGMRDVYRVAVDAKTTGKGSLGDHQVDWETLKEHRENHRAKYSLLVGPDPTGKRLMERARKNSIGVMSAEQLADLCRGHARGPLSLVDYEQLFAATGEIDTAIVDEQTEHLVRLRKLVSAICGQLPEKTDRFGRMSARDVQLSLGEEAEGISEQEIRELLDMLSHPLVGAVHCFSGDEHPSLEDGFVLATSRDACRRRIELLAGEIDHLGDS